VRVSAFVSEVLFVLFLQEIRKDIARQINGSERFIVQTSFN